MLSTSTRLSQGTTALVTGAAGYLGCAIVDQLLKQRYKVKATTRNKVKLEEFKSKADVEYGLGLLEIVEIPDLTIPGALDEALKDVSAVINAASDMSITKGLDEMVDTAISINREVLASVARAGGVQSFVSTSSRVAAFNPDESSREKVKVTEDDWFEEASNLALKTENPGLRSLLTYAAAKIEGERTLWKYFKQEKPSFRVNVCCPDVIIGRIHNPFKGSYTTASALINFSNNLPSFLEVFFSYPTYVVDVEDVAKIHIAALLDPEVNGKRIMAASEPFTALKVQEALKAIKEDYVEQDLEKFPKENNVVIDNGFGRMLLKKHYNQDDYKDLNSAVRACVSSRSKQ